ncbi:MAG: hypothetical protein B6I38_04850 [Anaerolineaceae bacterium 4572_5.1]|nr:MAG: hypothetical protein B6I38_04850 [Anaerolineaceae bacterium 4572_5.1]
MSTKTLSLIILAASILSACGAQTPEVTDTPAVSAVTEAPPATETLAATETPILEDTPTPVSTATLEPPENDADCTNAAAFVSDVTVPDNSAVSAGEVFTKTWRVKNTGTCIWWEGYTISHYSEETLNALESVPLPRTNPGETADISMELTAPDTAGTHQGNFVIKNPEELIMQIDNDSRLWVIINVANTVASEPTTTSGGDEPDPDKADCSFILDPARTDEVLAAINAYRAENNLPAYTMSAQLAQAAQAHANDMACNQLFVHTGSDGSTPQTRVAAAGYTGSKVTENVYGSYPPLTPQEVKEWWRLDQTDPAHNKNLISTQYTEVGIGYAFFDNFGYYAVVFGMP